ncbi:MAG: hypothetical protein ACLPTZ_11565 [Beijerinckiaceae bacterium]
MPTVKSLASPMSAMMGFLSRSTRTVKSGEVLDKLAALASEPNQFAKDTGTETMFWRYVWR